MKKVLKTWALSLLSALFIVCAAFAFMPANTNVATVYAAASQDLTLTDDDIYDAVVNNNTYTMANMYGTWKIFGTKDTEIIYRKPNDETVRIGTVATIGATYTFNSLLIIMIIVASILIASGIMLLILLFCKRRKQRKN